MIISKTNLQCVHITKHDKIPVLSNVVVEPDGTTVGSNGKALMLVSPVTEKVTNSFPLKSNGKAERIIFSDETAKEVIKNIPKDTKFSGVLEHCLLETNKKDHTRADFTLSDGRRTKSITGKKWERKYIDYKNVLQKTQTNKSSVRVAVNLKRMLSLLEAIDKACPDSSGSSPVFLEFTDLNDVIVRAVNQSNGQRCLGLIQSYKGIEGKWLNPDKWERSLYDGETRHTDSDDSADVVSAGVRDRDVRGSAKIPKKRIPPPKRRQ